MQGKDKKPPLGARRDRHEDAQGRQKKKLGGLSAEGKRQGWGIGLRQKGKNRGDPTIIAGHDIISKIRRKRNGSTPVTSRKSERDGTKMGKGEVLSMGGRGN